MKSPSQRTEIDAAVSYIRDATTFRPKVGLILGSGLGDFGSRIDAETVIPASDIPCYPTSSVQGHAGKLIFGHIRRKAAFSIPLLVFQGRVHFYETGILNRVIAPVIAAHALGVRTLIVTNAAGGMNSQFRSGDLMLITDVINLTLMGVPSIQDHRKQSARLHFDSHLRNIAVTSAQKLSILLHEGTYAWLKGPAYETPAEIQMLKKMGADAVGMSTVPEIFAANDLGMKILGISLISNLAAGISPTKLSHAEVNRTADTVRERFSKLMERIILSL